MIYHTLTRFMLWLFWSVICIGLGYTWAYTMNTGIYSPFSIEDTEGYIGEVERNPKVLAAMKYHGIRCCVYIGDQHVFEREGQTCQLFTKDFEESWNKGNM